MQEQEVAVDSVPHSLKLGLPLRNADEDEKFVSGLSTILVASIQEAKDRISQIEQIFCTQLYPNFQSKSKISEQLRIENRRASEDLIAKRRRIEELEREVDEGMALQKSLVELVQSKESLLKDSEEKRKSAIARFENCEKERDRVLGQIDDLNEKLRIKSREVEQGEDKLREQVLESERKLVKCLEERVDEGLYRKLLEQVESLKCELQAEKLKSDRLTKISKSLKSQHIFLRRKCGLTEENMLRRNKSESESDLAKHKSPITEPGLAFEDPDMTMGDCETAEVKSEIPEEDFGGLEKRTPDVFVTPCDTNKVKEKESDDDKGANFSPPPSSFHGSPKCPSSTKLVSVSGRKRPASSWRQTWSRQSRAGPDPHDDFLDTPLENIRENLNKEDLPCPIQKKISTNSSDDETQDLNAKCSPQKKQSSITVANKRSFKYVEPVRKKAERENLKGVECKQCKKFYDAVLPNADGKDSDSSKQEFRCEHHDGVSRHRYRYVPPMTPEGFWNIGFESEL
ncbi:protein gamma response 1 [Gastrolobium bilobum]|uniref:protein gamma response 1 n=1 Tax=Gastrolobium bilobum TaxID=150636 RepID=UPI002AAFE82D|nr:protein gamma response 1 [Gastrolobium bilobum]